MKCGLLAGVALLVCALNVAAQGKSNPSQHGWLTDFKAAKVEAKKTGKPMLVVFRCEQCEDFAKIDDQVFRLNKEIVSVADRFVRVRLTRITSVDLRLFEFDYDLTWFVFLLNEDETVYGRYGGRDSKVPDDRLSLKGMRFAMEAALESHKNPPVFVPREPAFRAEDFTAAKRTRGCIHCHNVNEYRRAELKSQGKWNRDLLWVYPLPENVGITLDVDRGNLVKSIVDGSPAAKAGIKSGDVVKQINGYSVASFADASFGLHKAPKEGTISIEWLRHGKLFAAKLELSDGWRKTNYAWRPSMFDLLPSIPLSGGDLTPEEKKELGISETRVAIRQDKFVHSTLKEVGLQKDDIIIGINGAVLDGKMEDFLHNVRGEFIVGDTVKLNVLRSGKPVEVVLTLK